MRKITTTLFLIISMIFSMSVFADDIRVKMNIESDYVMIADLVTLDENSIDITSDNDFMINNVFNIIEITLIKRKPDDVSLFVYDVINPMKFAVMQNSNFDRVSYNKQI